MFTPEIKPSACIPNVSDHAKPSEVKVPIIPLAIEGVSPFLL